MSTLWKNALDHMRGHISSENFETWLVPIHFEMTEGSRIKLRAPSQFHADWVETHYGPLLVEQVGQRSNGSNLLRSLHWTIDETLHEPRKLVTSELPSSPLSSSSPSFASSSSKIPEDNLNPKYDFENFVVGPSNQLAYATGVAAGSDEERRYNPLFIYGGVGLGKTHLVNAIGHTFRRRHPTARIRYVSAERFTNEFITALQTHRIHQFRTQYRIECDLLLMDDIQFLAGREQTQEEFFHTFNALYHSNKQIVVTSDVYPQQIGKMQERLISRFQSGMVADVQAPEIDTRVAILQAKSLAENIALPIEVAHYLAQAVRSNVRELEGTLIRLAVQADLLGCPIDLALAKEATRHLVLQTASAEASVEDVQRAVCDYFSVRIGDLKSKKRTRAVSFPRMVAMYLCRERLGTSYPELGERFGGKDHTTVMHAYRKIGGLLENHDEKVTEALTVIERRLGG